MAGRTPVSESTSPDPGGRRASAALRGAILIAAIWAAGILVLTLVSLIVDLREYGWQGLVAPTDLGYALVFSTASYLLRFLRWHLLATRLAPNLSLSESFVANTIGFGLIMTPARAGEVLKLLLLRQRTSVPVAMSAPVFLMEKLCEAVALAGLAVVSSLFLPWADDIAPASKLRLIGAAIATVAMGITFRDRLIALMSSLPVVRRLLSRPGPGAIWSHLATGASQVVTWTMLLLGLALSVAARLCDGVAIVWIASLYGISLSFAAGWFLIGSSGFLGGISMLPGGVGVAEGALIGLFVALGAGPAAAVAAALTSRILIFWVWVAIGLGLALRYALHPWAQDPEGDR